jgi:hypothetical protein
LSANQSVNPNPDKPEKKKYHACPPYKTSAFARAEELGRRESTKTRKIVTVQLSLTG